MNNNEIRYLVDKINKKYNVNNNFYDALMRIITFMEINYNLNEEEIIKQLELILKAKDDVEC